MRIPEPAIFLATARRPVHARSLPLKRAFFSVSSQRQTASRTIHGQSEEKEETGTIRQGTQEEGDTRGKVAKKEKPPQDRARRAGGEAGSTPPPCQVAGPSCA